MVEIFLCYGLVFGSLAPDYDILFRLTKIRFHIFQYDLKTICFLIYPIALLSAIFFHLVCRNVLIKNLPSPFFEKYQNYLDFDFIAYLKKHFVLFSVSVFLAILLHLFLDFCCHILDAYQVSVFVQSIIRMQYISNQIGYFSMYFLPILFSLFGFYLMFKSEFKNGLTKISFAHPKQQLFFWLTLLIITAIISCIKIISTEKEKDYWIDLIAISITSSFMAATYLCCFVFSISQRKHIVT